MARLEMPKVIALVREPGEYLGISQAIEVLLTDGKLVCCG
jgi:hypothetical protein